MIAVKSNAQIVSCLLKKPHKPFSIAGSGSNPHYCILQATIMTVTESNNTTDPQISFNGILS